jgi:hypothetical protein
VRVTITSPYRPMLTALLGNLNLRASSTMPIAH